MDTVTLGVTDIDILCVGVGVLSGEGDMLTDDVTEVVTDTVADSVGVTVGE